ncbi:MAG: DUF3108 domain-containing protein [Candidatus Eisenbacteria bacterium]
MGTGERTVRLGTSPRTVALVAAVAIAAALAAQVLAVDAGADVGRVALGPSGEISAPPFGVGEKLTFEIKYGFVSAGTAIMGIPRTVMERGHECYHIVSLAESNPFFSVFFTVRDVAESFMDVRELIPRRFEKRLREGDFRAHDMVLFDHERHVALYPSKGDRLVPISANTQDILSSLYYVRMMELEVGRSVFIDNHADKKNYPLEIKVLRRERINVPAGQFDCIVVEPVMRGAGLFSQKGKLTVWLTDNEVHIPVLMKTKVMIGSISAVLTDVDYADVAS